MKETTTVPAGRYFLGDPCYAFENHSDWMKLLESSDYFNEPFGEVKDKKVVAFGTAYGDGRYRDNFGNEYPVDAGLIGLTPVGKRVPKRLQDCGLIVEFDTDTECSGDNGVMQFGKYFIDTSAIRMKIFKRRIFRIDC